MIYSMRACMVVSWGRQHSLGPRCSLQRTAYIVNPKLVIASTTDIVFNVGVT